MSEPIEDVLISASRAIRDDIRGAFRTLPEYRDYLAALLMEASREIKDLREQIPAPPPES